MKNCIRNHYFVAFFSTLIISVGLLITSFFMPPQGKIDPSVLQACAIILVYPALAFATKAMDDNKKVKISTKIGTISVGKQHDDVPDVEPMEEPVEMMEGEEDA